MSASPLQKTQPCSDSCRAAGGSPAEVVIVLNENNTRHLNGVHTVFGKVTDGLDVVKTIQPNDKMTKVRVSDDTSSKE